MACESSWVQKHSAIVYRAQVETDKSYIYRARWENIHRACSVNTIDRSQGAEASIVIVPKPVWPFPSLVFGLTPLLPCCEMARRLQQPTFEASVGRNVHLHDDDGHILRGFVCQQILILLDPIRVNRQLIVSVSHRKAKQSSSDNSPSFHP